MEIKDIVKEKQPDVYKKLKKERKERLSFCDIKNLMEDAPVYKRAKGGALKQIR